ncbi:MAG: LysM peptidoglycan-binding domain-containing protein [Deltaproteobacteria bacterium]|nr:LysM peptidoglycan-binding domain-containing protein [Deltaproteobacteria bacterium]
MSVTKPIGHCTEEAQSHVESIGEALGTDLPDCATIRITREGGIKATQTNAIGTTTQVEITNNGDKFFTKYCSESEGAYCHNADRVKRGSIAPEKLAAAKALIQDRVVVIVRKGDTLGEIAGRNDQVLKQVLEENPHLTTQTPGGPKRDAEGNWIYPGDKVRVRRTSAEENCAEYSAAEPVFNCGFNTGNSSLGCEAPRLGLTLGLGHEVGGERVDFGVTVDLSHLFGKW